MLFDKLYEASDEAIKKMKKPLVKKKIKRIIESAWDDAEGRKIRAEERLADNRKDFEKFDINEILKSKQEIKKCSEVQVQIKLEYKDLFGNEMK